MKTVLQELAILPGVIGSCIVTNNTEVIASTLPDFFNIAMAKDTSNNIKRMMQMAAIKGLSPKTMCIRYDRFTTLAVPINDETVLLVLCETGSNTALVGTTAAMLSPELERKLAAASIPAAEVVLAEEVTPEQQKHTAEETQKALVRIKEALFETVGPVADMVYEDCHQRWGESGEEDLSRIFELLACLSREIDNSDLFAEFKEKISSLL